MWESEYVRRRDEGGRPDSWLDVPALPADRGRAPDGRAMSDHGRSHDLPPSEAARRGANSGGQEKRECPKCGEPQGNLPVHMRSCTGDE